MIWPRRGLRRAWTYIWHRVTRISATPHVIAIGFAAGAFASFTPFVGFHFIVGGILALIVRGSVLASALGTSVGNPLTFPFIWYATYNLGGYLLGYAHRGDISITFPEGMALMLFTDPAGFWQIFWDALGPLIIPMLVGSLPLGLTVAVISYLLVRPAVTGYQSRRKIKLEKQRLASQHAVPQEIP